MKKTYRITIEPASDAIDLFWTGVACGMLTYIVVAIAVWVFVTYWQDEYAFATAD